MKGANTTLRNKPTPLSFGWGMMENVVDGGPSASLRNKPRPLGFGWGGLGKKGCRWIWGDNFKKRTHIFRLWVGGEGEWCGWTWGQTRLPIPRSTQACQIFSKMLPDRHFSSQFRCFRYRFLVAEIALSFSF